MNEFAQEDRLIDIYLFHPEHKYFYSKEKYSHREGTGLPANSTDIPLPNKILSEGNIYIFTGTEWIETHDNFDKPQYKEINYTFCLPLPPYFTPSKIINPLLYFPQYNGISDYISPFRKTFSLAKKYELAQNKYLDLKILHSNFTNNTDPFKSEDYHITYRTESEFFIMMVRSIFDELVQLTFLLINNNNELNIDSIGKLKKYKDQHPECFNIVFGDNLNYKTDETGYLTVINDLFNSIKHSSLHYDAYQLYSYIPNIVSFQKEQNKFSNNKVTYHNHALDHLIFGFIDNFHRIIENQKKYVEISIKSPNS